MLRGKFTGPTLPRDLSDQLGPVARRRNERPGRRNDAHPGLRNQYQSRHDAGRREPPAQRTDWSKSRGNKRQNRLTSRVGPDVSDSRTRAPMTDLAPNDRQVPSTSEVDSASEDSHEMELNTKDEPRHGNGSIGNPENINIVDAAPARALRKRSRKELQEDEEIAALEKKLGIKSQQLPKSYNDDGLGDLLGDLDDRIGSTTGQHADDEDWLRKKRTKFSRGHNFTSGSESRDKPIEHDELEGGEDSAESVDGSEPGGDQDDAETLDRSPSKKKKENPYTAPLSANDAHVAKYVPPSLRKPSTSDTQVNARLRRQVKGLLNRLSEANLLSVLAETEELFASHPRQHVTSTLVNLLIDLTSDVAVLNDNFILLHAAFIAALYKAVGADFGAHLLDRIVLRFDGCYKEAIDNGENESNKSAVNLVSLLSQLYNLQVISSVIVFDFVRLFLESISELHTELLLRIVRSSGHQLRQDDHKSLKDIASSLQRKINQTGQPTISVRTQFMVDTIDSLKENKSKQSAASSTLMAEHLTRAKKTLGTMNSRNLRALEPLSISLRDIREADKRGKWWLVGASWKEAAEDSSGPTLNSWLDTSASFKDVGDNDDHLEQDLSKLARANKMTTPLRQRIFSALVTSTDHRDAHVRLLKLRLTQKQNLEIPHVVLHCAAAEENYNPYWTLVARKLCTDRRLSKAFLFGAWGFYRRMGASDRPGSEDDYGDGPTVDDRLTLRQTLNLAKLYANLLSSRALSISIFKHLDLPSLPAGSRARTFAEVMVLTAISQLMNSKRSKTVTGEVTQSRTVDEDLYDVFGVSGIDSGLSLGLRWFLEKVVSRSDLIAKTRERERVRHACEILCGYLAGTYDKEGSIP